MTNEEALTLRRGDIVHYNHADWAVFALFGRGGIVTQIYLGNANTSTYGPPHKVTLVERRDYPEGSDPHGIRLP